MHENSVCKLLLAINLRILQKTFILNGKELIMKKRFIFFAALAVFLAIAVTPVKADKPVEAGGKGGGNAVSIIKGPYLQQVTPETIVIMWETNTRADSQVDYDDGVSDPVTVTDSTKVKIHEVQLTNLAVDTEYSYTVTSVDKSKTVTSAQSTFATAPATERSFRFVAYGDTRTHASDHAAVIQAIINSAPDLVLHTGDLVENGDEYSQWGRQFFDPAYDLMINTPLLPIIGNHEGSGNLFRDFFSLGDNDDWFAFTYGGVRFIGLNTHNRSYSPGSAQHDWLVAELQSPECTSADWQIVYFHHPPYTATSGHSDDTNVQTYLVPLFEQYGVDIVFNGHSHAYERYFNSGIYYIVTGGGGAPLATLYEDTTEPIRQEGESTYHHCVIDVDVENELLTLSARDNDGYEFDTITLPPVDLTAPTASLLVPLDNGPDDLDADEGEVTVNTTQPVFDIQLSDVGDGIHDATVTSTTVALTKDGGVDYAFSYDADLDVITLTPEPAGSEFGDGLYLITLSGIADQAETPNVMAETTLSILIDTSIVPPVTLSFQQGVGGYSAMVDTMIRYSHPDQTFDDSATEYDQEAYQYQLNADTDSLGGPSHILLRFDDIIGSSQIPLGSTIVSATLRIHSTDDGNGGKLHRILQEWVDTAVTWNNSFGGNGIQADDTEAASVEDDGVPSNSPNTDVDLDVTATVQNWADGIAVNNGWAILPNGTNGWHIAAAEHPTLGYRPELIVEFITTGNQPPTVSITSPSDGAAFTEDDSITINADASDSDGTVTKVEFYQDSIKLGEDTGLPYSYIWNNVPVGSYSLTAKATDNEGATRTSDAVNITVNPAPDTEPPTAPTDLTATAVSSSQIDLEWADNGEVDFSHYNVYRSTTSGDPYTQIASNVMVSSYSDTGLTASTTYYYVVTAVDTSTNESGNSNEASATTDVLSLPGQATEPTPSEGQIRVNRNTVILSWQAGADATSHDVYFGTSTSPAFVQNQTGTTYDPPAALLRKTTYYWRIDEVNTAGTTTGDVWSFTTK